MKENAINKLEYNFEKEKAWFLEKYFICKKKYNKADLVMVDEIKEMLNRMEKTLNEVNNQYNLLFFDMEADEDYDYLSDGGVWVYNKNKNFISNCNNMLNYAENEYLEGRFSVNNYLSWVIDMVALQFRFNDLEIMDGLEVDINYLISDANSYSFSNRGVVFTGDNRNEKVNQIAEKTNISTIYEIILKKDDHEENYDVIDFLIKNIASYDTLETIVIIKNIDIAIYNLNLRTQLLTFLSNMFDNHYVILYCTTENPNDIDDIKKLAKIKFCMSGNTCYKI